MLTFPVEPMLAKAVPALPEPGALPGGCVYEPKYDGYRALVFHDRAGSVRVQSRGGHDITVCFPEIAAAVAGQTPPGVVLDGELVIWKAGRLDFPALQQRLASRRRGALAAAAAPASLLVFDLLAVDGTDIRGRPWSSRAEVLTAVLATAAPPLQRVPSTREAGVARGWVDDFSASPGLGVEGLVIKGAGTRYTSGKRGWLKYRIRDTHDAVVGAVVGAMAAPARLVVGYYAPTGRLRVAGATTVLGARQRTQVGSLLQAADSAGHPWPEVLPSASLGRWGGEPVRLARVVPDLVVEVSADTAFEHGRWRHLVRFVRVLPAQDPTTVGPPG